MKQKILKQDLTFLQLYTLVFPILFILSHFTWNFGNG